MSAVTPFEAFFFFGANDADEVNREFSEWYEKWTGWPSGGPLGYPDLTEVVKVVAVEHTLGHGDYVWLVRKGEVQRRETWMVREIPQ